MGSADLQNQISFPTPHPQTGICNLTVLCAPVACGTWISHLSVWLMTVSMCAPFLFHECCPQNGHCSLRFLVLSPDTAEPQSVEYFRFNLLVSVFLLGHMYEIQGGKYHLSQWATHEILPWPFARTQGTSVMGGGVGNCWETRSLGILLEFLACLCLEALALGRK